MKPESMVVPFWSPQEVESAINGALAHLAAGKVLAYPTETVYGFGGAVDERSVQQLVALKGRAPGKPFLLLVAASDMINAARTPFDWLCVDVRCALLARSADARAARRRKARTGHTAGTGRRSCRTVDTAPLAGATDPRARRPDHFYERQPSRRTRRDFSRPDRCPME